ncbi:MAG: 30S ribosomal protein S16 [Candidatus Roizmanbacteria bacterium]
MAVKIKLTRTGRKNDPKYRIIVAEENTKRDGKYIEKLGFYDPIANPHVLQVDDKKLEEWLLKGAQFSQGTYKLLKNRVKI